MPLWIFLFILFGGTLLFGHLPAIGFAKFKKIEIPPFIVSAYIGITIIIFQVLTALLTDFLFDDPLASGPRGSLFILVPIFSYYFFQEE